MARRARKQILFDSCYAHILSRSFEKRWIFEDSEDFEAFKGYLLKSKEKHKFLIHHYCLMRTHFHLAVSIPDLKAFSRGLQQVKWHYTARYNKRYQRSGPLWRERFKSLLIEDEQYLYACGLYVEENPLKAGLVEKREDWPYSSATYYLLGKSDLLLDPYEGKGIPPGVNPRDESFFTQGPGIGSELFQIHLREGLLKNMTVP